MDPVTLAATIVGSYLVPYLSIGADKIAQGVAGKLGQTAADHFNEVAAKLWRRVRGTFSPGNEQKALDVFEEDPEELKGKVRKTLQLKLEQDSRLKQELNDLVDAPAPDGTSTGAQIRDVVNAIVQDFRQADFRYARDVQIIGAQHTHGDTPSSAPRSPEDTPPAGRD